MKIPGRKGFIQHLQGSGLDIGPLHRPMLTHPGMQMTTVDRLPTAELRKHYPELGTFELTEADILDDAEKLRSIRDGRFDFVIAAHVIEHMRNPLLALKHWCRVTKSGQAIYLVVPDYRAIFDRDRPLTTLDHIVMDYQQPSTDRDWQHYVEYATLVDKAPNPNAHAWDLLTREYSIHFHTFTPESMMLMLDYFSLRIEPIKIIRGPEYDPQDPHEFNILILKDDEKARIAR